MPNITGSIKAAITNSAQAWQGALSRGTVETSMMGSGPWDNYELVFNASNASSSYVDGASVKPSSTSAIMLVKY